MNDPERGRRSHVLGNAQAVLAIEFLVAAQAIDWRVAMRLPAHTPKGHKPAAGGQALLSGWDRAEQEAKLFAERTTAENRPTLAAHLGEGTRRAYLQIRDLVPPLLTDRYLEPEVRRVRAAVEGGGLG